MNELQPKVSICIAQYNRSEELPACLDSLLKQDYPNFEIVVVNDGSPDPKVSEILADYSDRYENIITLNQDNTGFVGAINKAISLAQGEFIAIQGAGDISYSNRISLQMNFLLNNDDYGMVSCRYTNKYVGGDKDGVIHKISDGHGDVTKKILVRDNIINHGSAIYRKALFNEVGGYREFFIVAQDIDLWLRMLDYSKIFILNENLYERGLFVNDGIAVNKNKTILQRYLHAFAIQCMEEREVKGSDYVEVFGKHAGIFKKPCKKLSRFLARESLEYLRLGKLEESKRMLNLAKNQKMTLYVFITMTLVHLCDSEKIFFWVSKVLDKILPNSSVK